MSIDPEVAARALLTIRQAHRYCTSNPMYPGAHDFGPACPVLQEWLRVIGVPAAMSYDELPKVFDKMFRDLHS